MDDSYTITFKNYQKFSILKDDKRSIDVSIDGVKVAINQHQLGGYRQGQPNGTFRVSIDIETIRQTKMKMLR